MRSVLGRRENTLAAGLSAGRLAAPFIISMIQPDKTEIFRALNLFFPDPNDVIELRCFSGKSRIFNGFYRDRQKLIADAHQINATYSEPLSVFVCLNRIHPDLYARRPETFKPTATDEAVKNGEVTARTWLAIDVDPTRVTGISATDEQKLCARSLAGEIFEYWTQTLLLPHPIVADSGSGFHLLVRLADLPNTPEAAHAVKRVLGDLGKQFPNNHAKVDQTTSSAAQIIKLPGTIARKGADIPANPHRLAKLLYVPDPLQPIELAQLLTAFPEPPTREQLPATNGFDVPALLAQRDVAYTSSEKINGAGDKWTAYSLSCPFSDEHKSGFIIGQFENGALFATCHHTSCSGKGWPAVKQAWGLPETIGLSLDDIYIPPPPPPVVPAPKLLIVKSADVQTEEVEWVWPDRVVIGGINLLAGRGGIGKSYFICDLVARITQEQLLAPDGTQLRHGRVLYASGEDHLAKIVKPRVDKHGADHHRLEYVKGLPEGKYVRGLDVLRHCDLLTDALASRPDTIALVLDPISSFQGGADSNKVGDVRQFTAVLTQISEEFNIAVIGVHHFAKAKRDVAGDAVSGSHAYRDAARSLWLFALDAEDRLRRLMVWDKYNYVDHQPPGMAYRVIDGVIRYEQEMLEITSDELLQQGTQRPIDIALTWLMEKLLPGPMLAADLYIAAATENISDKTLKRAKKGLQVKSGKKGGSWWWTLPQRGQQEVQESPGSQR